MSEKNTSNTTEESITNTQNKDSITTNNTKESKNMENKTTTKTKENKEEFAPVFKIEIELNSYNEAVAINKPMNYEEGGKWQYSLFTVIKNVLNNENQETFNKEWNTILNFFNKNKQGVFNENYIYRFLENWPGSSTELTLFRRIVYLILETSEHTNRKKAFNSINLERLFDGIPETSKNKILSFYGL